MRRLIASVLTLVASCAAQINVQLVANWENPPFELRLLETVASENGTYYLPTVSKIASFPLSDGDDDEEPDSEVTDEELYQAVFDLLTPKERALYDIPLANKYHSPRVISHYRHYTTDVFPVFEAVLKKKCGTVPKTWLQYNEIVYCNPDDVYALMTDSQQLSDDEILLPFDRVIGTAGPILVLYGDVKDGLFKRFISNLYESSTDGKFRFVWRYTPQNNEERETLNGYGVDLTLKRTDYIVIDDRDIQKDQQQVLKNEQQETIGDDSFLSKYIDDIEPMRKEELGDLDLKLSSFVLSSGTDLENFQNLKNVINGLPKYASELVHKSIDEGLVEQVQNNAQIGLIPENSAMFINGAPLEETSQNVFSLYQKIKQELKFVEDLESLGFKSSDVKELISKFSLYLMFKNRGGSTSRYQIESNTSPVIYFNDIETDPEYSKLPNDLSVYLQRFQFGEVPPLRQNVHSTVFVIQPGNVNHLKILTKVFNAVIQNKIPQRIGIVPLIENGEDELLANNIYHLVETKGVRKTFKYIEKLINAEGSPKLLTDRDYVSEVIRPFLANFDINKPYIISNGVFHDLDSDWPYTITKQITEDVQYLTSLIYNGRVETAEDLFDTFYSGSKKFRNSLIIPQDSTTVEYKTITKGFLENLQYSQNEILEYSRKNEENPYDHLTLTLGGDLGSQFTLEQLLQIFNYSLTTKANLRVRVINQSSGATFIGRIKQALHESIEKAIGVVERILSQGEYSEFEQNEVIGDLLKSIDINSKDFLLLNGRFVKLDRVLDARALEVFVEHELDTRLSLAEALLKTRKFVPTIYQYQDWFEVYTSIITKTYYIETNTIQRLSASRYDFSNAQTETSIKFGNKETSHIHVLLTIDPVQEVAQRLVSLVDLIKDLPFVSIEILLQPQMNLEELTVKRFYQSNVHASVAFKEDGSVKEKEFVVFDQVPQKTLFTLDLDVHPRWIVLPKEGRTDFDNVLLENSGPVTAIYELENIIIEGNAFIDQTLEPPTGLSVQVQGSDTNVMTLFGYLQLKANPGVWDFSIKKGRSSELFSLLSVDSWKNGDNIAKESIPVPVLSLDGAQIFPRVVKKEGKENDSLIVDDAEEVKSDVDEPKSTGFFSKYLPKKEGKKKADINIFTIASGHLYERLLSIMTASVMANTKHTVKFWLIDNYMSPSFREFLPHLANLYGFEYELITYKWPSWLIGQREKQRTIWGYKILFLDVLFPQDLDKVIFVDADQIVRADMKELVDLDLEGAPYGYTPMGDSREEMEGFRFWKKGYWKEYLGEKFQYHISALYVIDLKKFRQIAAGDRLRQHYSLLSKDPKSLSNLDQDLPNNLQHQLKIFSLPQEWLWCETWCADEDLKTAKTIDLCNNPLTKEHKLDRARRQIPEWSAYDQEINNLYNKVFQITSEVDESHPHTAEHDEL